MESSDILVAGGCGDAKMEKASLGNQMTEQKPNENFTIDDLLDFPNDDVLITDGFFENIAGNSTDSSTVTAVDSCNSSVSGSENHISSNLLQFTGDLCVPYDDLAELEWLSKFVEDSFSNETHLKNLHLITGSKPLTPESSSSETRPTTITRNAPILKPKSSLPGKARSKRSRAAPCDWSTRLLHLTSPSPPSSDTTKMQPRKKRQTSNSDFSGRKCLHCSSEKTPQWRTGPMGPKTLCNACGVRYKSGRLVPEYRPAASPTFISARHSNSHRKVMELRRQKVIQTSHHTPFISQSSIFGISDGEDDFLIHHHNSQDYRHMI